MRSVAPDDPVAQPVRDPATLAKFPPTLVVVGTRDFALSSAVYLHSRLVANGVDARLHVWEGGRHAFFYDERVPEAREAYAVMARFFTERLR
jgi:acetyl esterase/lipase